MKNWISHYIGKPWVKGSMDCFDFVRLIERTHYNLRIKKLIPNDYERKTIETEFKDNIEFENWIKVKDPIPGDVVVLRMNKTPNHIGVWVEDENSSGILHCVEHNGGCFIKKDLLETSIWKPVSYHRHKSKL